MFVTEGRTGGVSDLMRLKTEARRLAGALLDELMALAAELHARPELSGEERFACERLAARLAAEGFRIERGAGGVPTAFVAVHGGAPGPRVAFLAEYDALPEIGHGCGHNLIAAAAVGAGLVLARLPERPAGQVEVIGTPAEETIGGKVLLAERGVFTGLDAALMVHPHVEERVVVESLACQSLMVTFLGKGAHAVAHADRGINALDPLLALFAARDALLRGSRMGTRIAGVILEGGVRPNMVPERGVGHFTLRAPTRARLDGIRASFEERATHLARAYGCGVEIRATDRPYDEMNSNLPLARAYEINLAAFGVEPRREPREDRGSLDMGTVSCLVPALHPFFAIASPGDSLHTRAFAEATLSPAGRAGLERAVATLAMTALDVLGDADLRRGAAEAHRAFMERRA
jgi:amidohydrolase